MKGVNVKIEKWSGLSFLNQGKLGSGSESQSDLMKSRRWVGGSCFFFFFFFFFFFLAQTIVNG